MKFFVPLLVENISVGLCFTIHMSARRKCFWRTHGKVKSQIAVEGGIEIWSAHFPLSVSEKDERWAWFNLPTLTSILCTSNVPSTGAEFKLVTLREAYSTRFQIHKYRVSITISDMYRVVRQKDMFLHSHQAGTLEAEVNIRASTVQLAKPSHLPTDWTFKVLLPITAPLLSVEVHISRGSETMFKSLSAMKVQGVSLRLTSMLLNVLKTM